MAGIWTTGSSARQGRRCRVTTSTATAAGLAGRRTISGRLADVITGGRSDVGGGNSRGGRGRGGAGSGGGHIERSTTGGVARAKDERLRPGVGSRIAVRSVSVLFGRTERTSQRTTALRILFSRFSIIATAFPGLHLISWTVSRGTRRARCSPFAASSFIGDVGPTVIVFHGTDSSLALSLSIGETVYHIEI